MTKIILATVLCLTAIQFCYAEELHQNPLFSSAKEDESLEGLINHTISSYADYLANFDPLDVKQYQCEIIEHSVEIKNWHAAGFSNVAVSHVNITGLFDMTLDLEIHLPKIISMIEEWNVEGGSFYGNGAGSLELENMNVSVYMELKPLQFQFNKIHFKSSTAAGKISITGLLNDAKFSQSVTNALNKVLDYILNIDIEFSGGFRQLLQDLIRMYLQSLKENPT